MFAPGCKHPRAATDCLTVSIWLNRCSVQDGGAALGAVEAECACFFEIVFAVFLVSKFGLVS